MSESERVPPCSFFIYGGTQFPTRPVTKLPAGPMPTTLSRCGVFLPHGKALGVALGLRCQARETIPVAKDIPEE